MRCNLGPLLEKHGLTQQAFADQVGMTLAMVNHVVHGRRRFPISKIIRAKEMLDCTLAELRPDLEGVL